MRQYQDTGMSGEVAGLLRHMDEVGEHREALQSLQGSWDTLAMLGELSGMGVQISDVRSAFGQLTGRLLKHLGEQALRKAALALRARSHVVIDILVRNLFERTADIGFLATDPALSQHAEASDEQRRSGQTALLARLVEYRRNYSVYDDVLLLSPGGQVLARLDERYGTTGASCQEPWLADALAGRAPYLERYGSTGLRPGAGAALLYACPVRGSRGPQPVGVLALSFDLVDECRRIFAALADPSGGEPGWTVLALLDASGQVIASSDSMQLPPGTPLGLGALGASDAGGGVGDSEAADTSGNGAGASTMGARVIRHGGRRWLAVSCAAQPYQGYPGPGWVGHAMVPLEHAFERPSDSAEGDGGPAGGFSLQQVPAAVRAALMASPQLFSVALRGIAPAADAIEADLKRTVWNGNVALGAQPPGRDAQFSRALLREIGRTGARSRELFTDAIANMNRTVVSATVEDSRARAALAIDIMDRNLYERANDCRWWALTPLFRETLAACSAEPGPHDAQAALGGVLKAIHSLYTVYANLLLFDRSGKVVAVSQPDAQVCPGHVLDAEWVARCLSLSDPRAYCVSAYEPSALYGGEVTCIYAAAVRAPGDHQRVVGGIAIVFDARPQFEAMLADSLAGSAGFAAFVEPGGRIVASTHADLPAGSLLPAALLPPATATQADPLGQRQSGDDAPRIVSFGPHHCALGMRRSSGYREFSARRGGAPKDSNQSDSSSGVGDTSCLDRYEHRMLALAFLPLARVGAEAGSHHEAGPAPLAWPASASATASGARAPLDLASFTVAAQWYGLPCDAVVEAVLARRITPLARGDARLLGTVLYGGAAIAVFDLSMLLTGSPTAGHAGGRNAGRSAVAGDAAAAPAPAASQTVIVMRGEAGQPAFGLLVESLGDHLQVPRERLERLDKLYPQGAAWVESLVRAPAGAPNGTLLMVLSAERLAAELSGKPLLAAA